LPLATLTLPAKAAEQAKLRARTDKVKLDAFRRQAASLEVITELTPNRIGAM
jgi:hypothetical protein